MKTVISCVVASLCLIACTNQKNNPNADKSQELMHRSIVIACQYRDSIKLAKDSATISRLMNDLDNALTKLNYQYPADIYMSSSENQNDNLAHVIMRTVELRDSILYRLAHPFVPADTVQPIDSVAVPVL